MAKNSAYLIQTIRNLAGRYPDQLGKYADRDFEAMTNKQLVRLRSKMIKDISKVVPHWKHKGCRKDPLDRRLPGSYGTGKGR